MEKRLSMHPHKPHATSQTSRLSNTHRPSTHSPHNQCRFSLSPCCNCIRPCPSFRPGPGSGAPSPIGSCRQRQTGARRFRGCHGVSGLSMLISRRPSHHLLQRQHRHCIHAAGGPRQWATGASGSGRHRGINAGTSFGRCEWLSWLWSVVVCTGSEGEQCQC